MRLMIFFPISGFACSSQIDKKLINTKTLESFESELLALHLLMKIENISKGFN